MSSREQKSSTLENRHLVLTVDGDHYAVNVKSIAEIVQLQPITRIPRLHQSIKGVVNLRGKVIPVVDLRTLLGYPGSCYTDRTCIVVASIDWTGKEIQAGLIVDTVEEVVSIEEGAIVEARNFGTGTIGNDYRSGVIRMEDRIVSVLEIDRVLNVETLCAVEVESRADQRFANSESFAEVDSAS